MKIGVDITPLLFPGSGVANYTYNLVKNLLLIDKKNEYRLFFTSWRVKKKYPFLDEFKNMGAKIYRFPFPFQFFHLIWKHLNIIPVEWFIGKIDVFYANDFLRSPSKIKTITTIHDLIWKLYPKFHKAFIIKTHEIKIKKTIKYGDQIVVDSKTTKKDLLKMYPKINEKKVHVIYPGINEQFEPINDKNKIKKVLAKYLNSKFLLYVGDINPRKNLITAIEVFDKLIKNKKFSNYIFLITGSAGKKDKKLLQLTTQLKLQNKVKFLGYVKDEDLQVLYSKAKLTVYLSSYEGFGLPPLESLACGTPVIAGDNSSMKETLPKEFLVNINDKKKILEKMTYLLTNKIKTDSAKIKKRFDWIVSTKKFLMIIQQSKEKN